jgi:hypothetical protein
VVGADFCGFCDLRNREIPGFASGTELFGNRWHGFIYQWFGTIWQSKTKTFGLRFFPIALNLSSLLTFHWL